MKKEFLLPTLTFMCFFVVNQSANSKELTPDNPVADRTREIQVVKDGNKIVIGNARFSLVSPNLIRLEYSENRKFEDRPTIRAIGLSQPIKIKKIGQENNWVILEGENIRVKYLPSDAPFSADNLTISWKAGNMQGEWKPGDEDLNNLGGMFTSLDHADRGIVAAGVHPAGLNHEDRKGELNLWPTWWSSLNSLAKKSGEDVTWFTPEYIIKHRFNELPDNMKEQIENRLKYPPGVLSKSGYFVLNESESAVFDPKTKWLDSPPSGNYQNWYFFAYGKDYKLALKNFVSLCGKTPMIPRWAFGSWYSVFQNLTDNDYKKIVEQHHNHKLPFDVLVVDMDWHIDGWYGWDWNKKNFPDPEKFIQWVHDQDLKITLNLHCESMTVEDSHFASFCQEMGIDVEQYRKENKTYILDFTKRKLAKAFFKTMPVPNEKMGVDFWWTDIWMNRTEKLGVNEVLWANHLFHNHMEKDLNKRGLVLSRYAGIGSHRYPAFFSGDVASQWEILEHEIDVSARGGNVGVNYISHDLGGFKGAVPGENLAMIDPELYIRWMQFGALNPIMRIHSDHGIREPWKYGEKVLEIVRKAYQFHISLVPYFYHLSRTAYDEGIPIISPLYLYYPDDKEAYNYPSEYLIGEKILVAPAYKPGNIRSVYLPSGRFYSIADSKIYEGPINLNMYVHLDKIPIFIKAGSIIPRQKFTERVGISVPDPLVLDIYPGGDDQLNLYEDDGESLEYRSGKFSRLPIMLKNEDRKIILSVKSIEGSYRNMPTHRCFEIWVNFVEKPARVKIDDKDVKEIEESSYKYFKEERRLKIKVGSRPVSKPWQVEVDF